MTTLACPAAVEEAQFLRYEDKILTHLSVKASRTSFKGLLNPCAMAIEPKKTGGFIIHQYHAITQCLASTLSSHL
jgi:hypothetical protein